MASPELINNSSPETHGPETPGPGTPRPESSGPESETRRSASPLECRVFTTASALIAHEDDWNELWRRSSATRPTARADQLLHWLNYFAHDMRFAALAVYAGRQLVAAMPLVEQKRAKFLRVGALPSNHWSTGGDLMFDRDYDPEILASALVSGVKDLPWSVLWIDEVIDSRDDWRSLIQAFQQATTSDYRRRYEIGRIDTKCSVEEVRKKWSKNHRRKLAKHLRRLEEHGEVRLRVESPTGADVADMIRQGFEIEDRSWKGEAGSSVLKSSGMLTYYTEQAELAAEAGQLVLAFLDTGPHSVAFEYGWFANRVYHSFKVGYDSAYAACSPGQALFGKLIEHFCEDDKCDAIDCMGPMTDAVASWKPHPYGFGRLVAGANLGGRCVASLYRNVWR